MAEAPLSGKTMFISGASRGIGLAIAKRAAAERRRLLALQQDAPDSER